MHDASFRQMARILKTRQGGPANVLDVGSLDVNGTYRPIVDYLGWRYTGLDMCKGPNVDIVSPDPYRFPVDDNAFDIVISGSTMEHVQAIWLWVPELVRVLRPNGMLAIITHTNYPYHRYPVDCWRILPDGARYLFDQTGWLKDYEISMYNETDISMVATKRRWQFFTPNDAASLVGQKCAS